MNTTHERILKWAQTQGREFTSRTLTEQPEDIKSKDKEIEIKKEKLVPVSAMAIQEGGSHYKDMPIQPVEYIHKNGIGYFEGNVIKYMTRWRKKNGIDDLKKARHYIDLLIELEGGNHHG